MIVRELSSVFVLFLVLSSAIVGFGAAQVMGDDKAVEEGAEEIIEQQVEEYFDLPDGKMKGKIDLTPWSKEEDAAQAYRISPMRLVEQ